MQYATTERGGTNRKRPHFNVGRLPVVCALLLVLLLTFAAGTYLRDRHSTPAGTSAGVPVAVTLDAHIATLQQRLSSDPADTRAAIDLSAAYLQKVRETGDTSWYAKSEGLLQDVLQREPDNAEALAWLGALSLSRHEFAAGLDWGRRALAADPDLLAAFPVVIDASIELGQYDAAVTLSDQFIQLRPDLPSYTRVAYLRELYGDPEGAAEALLLALDTVPSTTEAGAWTRVQLGNLYLAGGAVDAAEQEYRRTLSTYPDYPPAEAGLAKVMAARGDAAGAIGLLIPLVQRMPLPEYVILLGDLYTSTGQPELAAEQYALVEVQWRLLQANGVVTDLEYALYQADHLAPDADPEAVVTLARAALLERPGIYGHDTLAWALYRAGQFDAAQQEIEQALQLGTRDALLHYHAGKIAAARGDNDTAIAQLQLALEINPHFSVLHADDARVSLDALLGASK